MPQVRFEVSAAAQRAALAATGPTCHFAGG